MTPSGTLTSTASVNAMSAPVAVFDPFGGRTVTIRPARPDDLVPVGSMLARLSASSTRLRFFSPPSPPRVRFVRPLVEVDHEHHETLVALCGETVIGFAEYVRADPTTPSAEVAVVIEDAYQHQGVAAALFRALARIARHRGIDEFTAVVLPDNRAAIGLARSLSPDAELAFRDGEIRMRMPLRRAPRRARAPTDQAAYEHLSRDIGDSARIGAPLRLDEVVDEALAFLSGLG